MKATVYIESSVISYLTARPSRDLITAAHQQITQEWWAKRDQFDCYISQTVIDEIQAGDAVEAAKRMASVRELPLLGTSPTALELSKQLVGQGIIPPKAARDAIHIALAAASGIDFLVTWNCTHIANAQIEMSVGRLCRANGYSCPVICTPEELMGD